MIQFAVETRRCDRGRAHRRHRYVPGPRSVTEYECPGHNGTARTLGELLARRPDLVDLTTVTVANRIQVMCA